MPEPKCYCEDCGSHKYKDKCCDPKCFKKSKITKQQKNRVVASIDKREELLRKFRNKKIPCFEQNYDESLPHYWGSFNKCLPQNNLGLPDPCEYQQLLKAVKSGDQCEFEKIKLGGHNKFVNPLAAYAHDVIGCDSWDYRMPAAPSVTSAEAAAEVVELYAKAELRDIPFNSYGTNEKVSVVVNDMNKLTCFTGPKKCGKVTAGTLFRGNTCGDLLGNYVSQFLILPIPNGAITYEQKYNKGAGDFLTCRAELLDVLKGKQVKPVKSLSSGLICTGRDLAEYVHSDYPVQTYLNAALIMYGLNVPHNSSNPYGKIIHTCDPFVTMGIADITSFIGVAARLALKAAWVQKWCVNMKIRPEGFGFRVDTNKVGETCYPIHNQLLENDILKRLFAKNGNCLLPQAYPEGSPAHPAYPAGHATIAGACVTVLKAFFDGCHLFPCPKQVSSDCCHLEKYTGSDVLTIGHELDKLASNIAIGRDIAGVHYRSDGDQGILLGEKVAIFLLQDYYKLYGEKMCDWHIRGFEGKKIYIYKNE